MRVAILSFVLACIAGIAAFLMLGKDENLSKQPDLVLSQPVQTPPATGLVPARPANEGEAKPAGTKNTEAAPSAPATPAPATPPAASASEGSQIAGLAPPPLDPGTPDEVMLASHPALILRGQARWDDAYSTLAQAFSKLREQSQRFGLKETGYPLTVFVETDDQGFKFEAELPVESLPAQRPADLSTDLRFGATPEGRAIRFVHRGAYDEIDSTYEAISAYVDVKGFEVKDTLIEEYIEMGKDSSDMAIEVHIFVQPTK